MDPQFSQDELYLLHWNHMDTLVHRLHNRREQQITCTAYSAAKDDSLRADDSQNISHRDS